MLNSEHLPCDGTNFLTLDTFLVYHDTIGVAGNIVDPETFLTGGAVMVGQDVDWLPGHHHQSLSQLNIFSFLKMFRNAGHSLGVEQVSGKCS